MKRKQLEILQSLGTTRSVGWVRDDIPSLFHTFADAERGARFVPSNGRGGPHWPCPVCEAHGFTEWDFHTQMTALGATA